MITFKRSDSGVSVGIGIPCHIDDYNLLHLCLKSISYLNPKPSCILVDLNRGEELKTVRNRIFDTLFNRCDIVLNCDADFYLFPDILKYIRTDAVTSFAFLTRSRRDIPQFTLRLLGFGWTGCYSIPRNIWNSIRDRWDGTDTSIKNIVKRYVFVKSPKYYVLRPWREGSKQKLLQKMSTIQRIKWMMTKI